MSKPDAKRRYRRRRAERAIGNSTVGVTVRFTPYVDGKMQAPLYPCNWCGKLVVATKGALCDDCIPF